MTIPSAKELIEAGAHIGHQKSKWNPKMAPFVFGVRNNIRIINVYKTIEKLEEAIAYMDGLIKEGKKILFVGVKIQARDTVKEVALALKMPYITGRWIGGLITNFKIIRDRVVYFKDLEEKQKSGEIEKYTKKERLSIERSLMKLKNVFDGIRDLTSKPEAIFISDVNKEKAAIAEARKAGISVIAIVDTDGDPSLIDWVIPANDGSVVSLNIIYKTIQEQLVNVKVEEKKGVDPASTDASQGEPASVVKKKPSKGDLPAQAGGKDTDPPKEAVAAKDKDSRSRETK